MYKNLQKSFGLEPNKKASTLIVLIIKKLTSVTLKIPFIFFGVFFAFKITK